MEVALSSDALLLFVLKGDAFELAPFIAQVTQSLAQNVNQRLKGGKDTIVKVFFAQFIPDMLNRIQFWTVGRLRDQADISGGKVADQVVLDPLSCHTC